QHVVVRAAVETRPQPRQRSHAVTELRSDRALTLEPRIEARKSVTLLGIDEPERRNAGVGPEITQRRHVEPDGTVAERMKRDRSAVADRVGKAGDGLGSIIERRRRLEIG